MNCRQLASECDSGLTQTRLSRFGHAPVGIRHLAEQRPAAQNSIRLNCALIMSDDEERYNVFLLFYSNRIVLIGFY